MTAEPIWIVMPVLSGLDYTEAAIADCLAQSVPTRLLVINQGVDEAFRRRLERIAEAHEDRIFLWSHQPPLPSLAATWNRALDFVWEARGQEALVVNNDVRLATWTVEHLAAVAWDMDALFVSAVGVTEAQFEEYVDIGRDDPPSLLDTRTATKGGPDFSCFLIARECHATFRFDEAFTPAYCEDLDTHRRILLAGEGRRIFSINLPYLHYAAGTLKTVDTVEKQRIEAAISAGSRAYYARKWGGPVNQERFLVPYAASPGEPSWPEYIRDDGTAMTPYLQAHPPSNDPRSGTISPTLSKPIAAPLIFGEKEQD